METNLYKSSLSRRDRIGKGSYSVVFKGYRKDDASKTVAIKRIENDHDFFTENATKDIDALRSVTGHKNVVKLLELHSDAEYIYIIMEYCEKGDLEDYLSNGNSPSYELKLEIMKQCAKGVAYIHGLNPPVVHRDIKCNNILIMNTPAGVVVKIADFGLAKILDKIDGDTNRFFMSTDAGSLAFRAPEMCKSGRKQYNASVDIYSLGLVFTVLINYDGKDKLFEPHTANEPRDTYWPYSMRQLDAHTKKTPMPELFFTPVVDQKYPQIKAIITAMTRFDFNQRTDILLIKAQLKKESQEHSKRNVAAEHAEAMELIKSQHDQQMRELNNRFSALETEYSDEVQRSKKLEDCLEDENKNATALELVNINLDEELQEMNKRFFTQETEYSNEVRRRKELEDCLADEKGNSKAIELVNLKLEKDMQEMNKRFSMMDLKYSNGVQRRIKLEEELQKEYQSLLNTQSEKVNQDTVESVLKRHQEKPLNNNVQVEIPQQKTSIKGEMKTAASKIVKTKKTDAVLLNCIEVTGIKPGTPTDFVQLFFENNKKSGGGGIESVNHNSEQGEAVITFKEEATCKSVINRHKEAPICLESRRLQIQELDQSLFGGTLAGINSCAIQVSGLPVNSVDEGIVMFFENRHMSGGGVVEEIFHIVQDGMAVITFASSEVAQRVVGKHRSYPLIYDDTLLQVKMVCSNSRPSQVAGEKDDHLLFIKNVGLDTDTEDIKRYLELLPRCQIKSCVFGIKAGTVLVEFITAPGYKEFYKLSCQKPLKGNMVDMESVAKSREIEVYGITGLSTHKLKMYFEHHKSKGGDVEKVKILSDDNCAIVTFVEFGVAEKVLAKTNHTLEQNKLLVKQHYHCIGILPPEVVDIKAIIPLSGGKVIYIVQGDLTKYAVDAIVNAANNRMDHVGGVALAIVNRGGAKIQRECTKHINTKGILKEGQVYTSQAGKLPCKKVIHTVGPVWQGGYTNEVSDLYMLYDSVYVALQEASRLGLISVAIPAISCGIFGFPKSGGCKTILEAVSDYLKREKTSLTGVHIVDNNNTLVDVFKQEAFRNHGGIDP